MLQGHSLLVMKIFGTLYQVMVPRKRFNYLPPLFHNILTKLNYQENMELTWHGHSPFSKALSSIGGSFFFFFSGSCLVLASSCTIGASTGKSGGGCNRIQM